MAEPKASTLQQKFGFSDPDLTSPKHDELMMWLTSNTQVLKPFFDRLLLQSMDKLMALCEKYKAQWSEPPLPQEVVMLKPEWEAPVLSGKYTIGFIDLKVSAYRTVGGIILEEGWGHPGSGKCSLSWQKQDERRTLLCEIKPVIRSVGELIRQLRMYQTHINHSEDSLAVVSPDDRFRSTIEDQGFPFINPREHGWSPDVQVPSDEPDYLWSKK